MVDFYNQLGTAEQWIKEGNIALTWTRLSGHVFRSNEVRLQLFALAYNLGNFLRMLDLPRKIQHWTLTTLREKLIKIGAKVVRHSGYVTFQMAELGLPRDLFAAILRKIDRLRVCPGTGLREDLVEKHNDPKKQWGNYALLLGKGASFTENYQLLSYRELTVLCLSHIAGLNT
jgi:hypothetical protein